MKRNFKIEYHKRRKSSEWNGYDYWRELIHSFNIQQNIYQKSP